MVEAALKYGASTDRISVWLRIARTDGLNALDITKKQGRPKGMGRPKKKAPQTELEKLREENLKLRIENELLKKSESFSRRKGSPSAQDWAQTIQGLRLKCNDLQTILEIQGMARSTYYYHISHINSTDKYADIRNVYLIFLKNIINVMVIVVCICS